jgi:hypothetical protein
LPAFVRNAIVAESIRMVYADPRLARLSIDERARRAYRALVHCAG